MTKVYLLPNGLTERDILSKKQCPICKKTFTSSDIGIIGIEVKGIYDGIIMWECYECKSLMNRFDKSDYHTQKALKYFTDIGFEVIEGGEHVKS